MNKKVETNDWYRPEDYQGRSRRQVEINHKIQGIAILGLLITFIASLIYALINSNH
jgi:hypothetical protein